MLQELKEGNKVCLPHKLKSVGGQHASRIPKRHGYHRGSRSSIAGVRS